VLGEGGELWDTIDYMYRGRWGDLEHYTMGRGRWTVLGYRELRDSANDFCIIIRNNYFPCRIISVSSRLVHNSYTYLIIMDKLSVIGIGWPNVHVACPLI